jgi:hypothetical protein
VKKLMKIPVQIYVEEILGWNRLLEDLPAPYEDKKGELPVLN